MNLLSLGVVGEKKTQRELPQIGIISEETIVAFLLLLFLFFLFPRHGNSFAFLTVSFAAFPPPILPPYRTTRRHGKFMFCS